MTIRATLGCAGLVAVLLSAGCASKRGAEAVDRPTTLLGCTLRVPAQVRPGEPVMLHFRLTNRSSTPLHVLDWHTPLEGLRANMLRVRHEGQELLYQGPMMKRGNPPAEAYRAIPPGGSVEAELDVTPGYELDRPGRYLIAFRGPLHDLVEGEAQLPRPLEAFEPANVLCNEVETERLAF